MEEVGPVEFHKSELREWIESIAGSVLTALFIMVFLFQTYKVEGKSMEPNLFEGQRLIVDKVTYRFRPPKPGEVVVIKPKDPTKKFVKRVIATEGQNLQITNGNLRINGLTVHEPYILEKMADDFEWTVIPQGTVFVMGDNRNRSMDSRDQHNVGFVPLENVVGRAVLIYWPLKQAQIIKTPELKGDWDFDEIEFTQ
ncbi:MAG: signal peptidase I [Firmicutes bacterium]|nr:signal peptidase I [Bacillota bacterium]